MVDDYNMMSTPLYYAAKNGHANACGLLLDMGAKNMSDSIYDTPLMIAVECGHINIVNLLVSHDKYENDCMWADRAFRLIAKESNWDKDMMRLLVRHGADIDNYPEDDYVYEETYPILHYVVHCCLYSMGKWRNNGSINHYIEKAKFLIELGANVNEMTEYHNSTPLHLAVRIGCVPMARLLLEHGADVNIEDYEDETPIQLSKSRSMDDLLIEYGADIDYSDDSD
jgi:ankyrin repeat protein